LAKLVVAPAVWIVALWVPLRAAEPLAEALAGEHTSLTFRFSVTIAISIALGAGMLALAMRTRAQRKELQRLRRRCELLERELGERGGA
jgi:hypothetical protein